MLFCGLILIIIGIAAAVLLYLLRYEQLWHWYEVIKAELALLETQIAHLDDKWLFVATIFLLFAIKSFNTVFSNSSSLSVYTESPRIDTIFPHISETNKEAGISPSS